MHYTQLELTITDFCNLNCPLCAQGIPIQKDKRTMSIDYLKDISVFFKPYEFSVIKVSGGEPTLHPQFSEICKKLPEFFPSKHYVLATNGFKLEKYRESIGIFDIIDLSNYPGLNDEVYDRLIKLNMPGLKASKKKDYKGMKDIYFKANLRKDNICKYCDRTVQLKIVQDYIYPCCVVFGLSLLNNIDVKEAGVRVDKDWRQKLANIDLERFCKICWLDVNILRFWLKKLKRK